MGGGGSDNKWNVPIRHEENKVESSKDDFLMKSLPLPPQKDS